ncbi:AER164Cp [Eremothecium gossypii ATCC 10895]|uniref:cystathionine gamma-synthase n=1 Tax=Eremothecium gossypii (strain ATCC 10895 / CBS 109.51 / FGSC 9923 / NRRL Y-1056) TaxID=284811 RepID=Q756W2_EREGS|nr:AER164Cp [Eremothecium gossypii ATCC 10895]AAS52846.2 AER164Cp [Eremothecium gossypii ATCC 10895]AEY97153.1 FAER164Cp [Eremothecium gossypii FDAG1]
MIAREIGEPIPPNTRHAISVSLPTWDATVGYEEGREEVVKRMETGYPRFYLHKQIQRLATVLEEKYAKEGEACLILPSYAVAKRCREFMQVQATARGRAPRVRILQLATAKPQGVAERAWRRESRIAVVFFPREEYGAAKRYWQHTGEVVSSRQAEYVLHELFELERAQRRRGVQEETDEVIRDEEDFIEQRYGRNLDFSYADRAKELIRRRIAKHLVDVPEEAASAGPGSAVEFVAVDRAREDTAASEDAAVQAELIEPVGPGGAEEARAAVRDAGSAVDPEKDVFLFPSGMAAIFCAHRLLLQLDAVRVNRTRQDDASPSGYASPHSPNGALVGYGPPYKKTVMFGFPYTDTLSILRVFNHTHFLGSGDHKAMAQLEDILHSGEPILAVFIETPSNPLLKMGDLQALRRLADIYGFYLVVDDTLGGFVNIDVLPHADLVCSSLTKIFSGDSNVMAGSLVVNPASRLYDFAQGFFHNGSYEDLLWCEDAIYLERNSRDCASRSLRVNKNTELLLEKVLLPHQGSLFKKIFYPTLTSEETKRNYDAVRCKPDGGYGGLFSLTFHEENRAKVFFDTLELCKGPSLGTNFTLACPYTVLAHYAEMDVVAEYGLERSLVRVSVGLEDFDHLRKVFQRAIDKALATRTA